MKILVTGATGFLGKNLVEELKNIKYKKDRSYQIEQIEIMECNSQTTEEQFEEYCIKADVIYHFAAVQRPKDSTEFESVNVGLTKKMVKVLEDAGKSPKIIFASSIQALLAGRFKNSEYGKNKIKVENILKEYARNNNAQVYIYRFPGLFGKWYRPNYTSVVATFCYNVNRSIPIHVDNPSTEIELAYIDDVLHELIMLLLDKEHIRESNVTEGWKYCYVPVTHIISVGELANLINEFKEMRHELSVPDMSNELTRKMWATYLSYIPENELSYPLKMNVDERGCFAEIIRTKDRGQFSVNICKPGVTKGQHWHHSKNERFVVVSGKGLIQFRKIGTDRAGKKFPIIDYHVSGDKIEVVDIPVGYTHNLINEGDTDLITFIWASEIFDPEKPDTFHEDV